MYILFQVWGGENIEFSLRVWTCGGEMEIVPCSKVGHIYKQRNVYSYPKVTIKEHVSFITLITSMQSCVV